MLAVSDSAIMTIM